MYFAAATWFRGRISAQPMLANARFSTFLAATCLLVALCSNLVAQSPTPAESKAFQVHGTVLDPIGAAIPGVTITFKGDRLSKTVTTNSGGNYEAILPLGDYTMTAEMQHFKTYRRPLFRVASQDRITFNIALLVAVTVDPVRVGPSGKPLTAEELKSYGGEAIPWYSGETIPVPSDDGIPFQLYSSYARREHGDGSYIYTGEDTTYGGPVFVAYNLFSLRADRVTYYFKTRELEAAGHVIVANESGETQRTDSIRLKLENGQAIPLPN